jgi:hypothetical protein
MQEHTQIVTVTSVVAAQRPKGIVFVIGFLGALYQLQRLVSMFF